MGIFSGALTVRRYRVVGQLPDGFREDFAEALRANAFREPRDPARSQETQGWVEVHNLLDTSFDDINRWLYDRYLVFALRIDKKVLPAKLFKAHLDKRVRQWCEEHVRARCPTAIRGEIREQLEAELLARSLPRAQVYEACWNLDEGWLAFHNLSDGINEHFRKLFFRTFGMTLLTAAPLDLLLPWGPELAQELQSTGGMDYRPEVTP